MTTFLIASFMLVSFVLVIWLGLRAIYFVIFFAFTQNFILPFLLTTTHVNVAVLSACLYFKDILAMVVFLYALREIYLKSVPLRLSVIVLMGFTSWCMFRGLIGILLGDNLFAIGRWIRDICAPLEFTAIGMAFVTERFTSSPLRRYVKFLVYIAIVALLLVGPLGRVVWGKYVNIASYNELVKHESSVEQDEAQGVNGSGNMSDRAVFAKMADYRAMGTFGEPISMAFNMAFALVLALFVLEKRRWVATSLLAAALFFSFTRSAWIFFTVTCLVILLRRRKLWWIVGFIALLAASIVIIAPLRHFLVTTIDLENSSHPHAVGVRTFYTDILEQPGVIAGKGINNAKLMESGYGNLVEIFGIPAYLLFLLFCAVALIDMAPKSVINDVMQGIILATLVVMNFSYYPFAFNPYVMVWLLYGAACSGYGLQARSVLLATGLVHHLSGNNVDVLVESGTEGVV